jgi:hypothetical protein
VVDKKGRGISSLTRIYYRVYYAQCIRTNSIALAKTEHVLESAGDVVVACCTAHTSTSMGEPLETAFLHDAEQY